MTERTPSTRAGQRLDTDLAYDYRPESYLPGDYFQRYRDVILAIEAEARADALREVGERLDAAMFGHHPACCGGCDECFRVCWGYHGPERRKDADTVNEVLRALSQPPAPDPT